MGVLQSKGKLHGVNSVKIGLCEDCIFGKQNVVCFSKGSKAPKGTKLELVHTDVWGPSPVKSIGSSRYYVTFIDDATKKYRFLEE